MRIMTGLLLTLALCVAARDMKTRRPPADSPLSAQLIANKEVYELPASQRGAAFRKQLKRQDAEKPDPPAVDLTFELTNTGHQPVTYMLGSDQSRLTLRLDGPGAVTVDSGRAMTEEFRLGRPVTLAPGARHQLPIKALRWGIRDIGTFGYWTEPGEYTITASYTWIKEGEEATQTITAAPVKVTVKAE